MPDPTRTVALATTIVMSYARNNKISLSELPNLIRLIRETFDDLDKPTDEPSPPPQPPAVSIRRSIHPDYLICLEDGKKLTMLKRHLRTCFNMSTDDYRAKWGLPPDYPMVASNYAAKRSMLAKKIGLGRTARGQKPSSKA